MVRSSSANCYVFVSMGDPVWNLTNSFFPLLLSALIS